MKIKFLIVCFLAVTFINQSLAKTPVTITSGSQNDLALALEAEGRGEFDNSLKILQKVVSQNEKDIKALTQIARVYFKLRKPQEGIESINKALAINPKYIPAYNEIIDHYQSLNNLYELRLIYQDMIQNIGEKGEYITKLCTIFYQDSLYDDAKKYCAKGIELDPKEAQNFVNLGLTYKELGDLASAEKNLKYAAQKFGKSAIAQSTYAYYFEEKKDFKKAYEYYKNAMAAAPDVATYMVFVANMAFELENYEEALGLFEKSCKLDKTLDYHFRKATNTFRLKKNQKWLTRYEQVFEKCL